MAQCASPGALDHTVVGWRIISGMNGQDTIEIIVNGDARQVSQGARVMDLVKQLELAPERLAIELNLSILPRAKWAETELRQGDRVEMVHFVGGG
jgi:thiamine biosynthesis protein ThiS